MSNEIMCREWTEDSALKMLRRNTRSVIKSAPASRYRFVFVLRNTAGLTCLGAIDYLNKSPHYIATVVSELP